MSLNDLRVIDAIGVERETGSVVLTIADSWHWDDTQNHLIALQEKLNAYFEFVESGEISEAYPNAIGRSIFIDLISRFPLCDEAIEFWAQAETVASSLGIKLRRELYAGSQSVEGS